MTHKTQPLYYQQMKEQIHKMPRNIFRDCPLSVPKEIRLITTIIVNIPINIIYIIITFIITFEII